MARQAGVGGQPHAGTGEKPGQARRQAGRSEVGSPPQQPEYCKNAHRSIKPEILVAVGICTHLGCSPTFRPDLAPADLGADWLGGFYCPCHGSKFDLAARVYSGVPAPSNMEIPRTNTCRTLAPAGWR